MASNTILTLQVKIGAIRILNALLNGDSTWSFLFVHGCRIIVGNQSVSADQSVMGLASCHVCSILHSRVILMKCGRIRKISTMPPLRG
jgi:hypothetical protein